MLLVRALYYSQAASTHREEIDTVLAAARRNNPALGLTGALVHDRGRYVQVLEGARPVVSATLARIAADPRHTRMTVAEFCEIGERRYPGWIMAFADADARFHPVRLTDFDTAPAEAIHRQLAFYLVEARDAA
ncbi:MAG: BLUF domain-containing protein [Oceanicaulis sp.]